MCWCNPNIRTPQCKSINCIPPTKQEPAVRPWESSQADMFPREAAIEMLKQLAEVSGKEPLPPVE